MTDAEFCFNQTSRERKRDGRGYYNKKKRGGKFVRLPSDTLTRKEKAQLNGEVKLYSFSKPMSWKDFIQMPDDLKQKYMDTLCEQFANVPNELIAHSMGVKQNQLSPFLSKHGIKLKRQTNRMPTEKFLKTEDGKAWVRWHEESKKPEIKVEPIEEPVVEVVEEPVAEVVLDADDKVMRIAQMLAPFVGTGAKVTIELTL